MRASVIVPAYAGNEEGLRQVRLCMAALRPTAAAGLELLVVDDASPKLGEAVRQLVEAVGGRYLRMSQQSGPALARNYGASVAAGDILLFFDADVVVHADTVELLLRRLEAEPGLAAVMGSYDDAPEATGTVSQFRNLLHCFVHHESAGPAQTFWTGCGAVRREWFQKLGGFSERYRVPSIEDVEFGYRLTAAGGKIWLDPKAQVQHLKLWTLEGMITTDLWKRAVPWTQLMREHPLPQGLNFSLRERAAALSVGLMGVALLAGLWGGGVWWSGFALCWLLLVALKWKFVAFLVERRGVGFAVAGVVLLAIHLATALLGLVIGTLRSKN